MRIFPRATTYNPAQGWPSAKTISPGAYWRGTARSARNCSSESVRPENMATFASVRRWSARASATEPIVANAPVDAAYSPRGWRIRPSGKRAAGSGTGGPHRGAVRGQRSSYRGRPPCGPPTKRQRNARSLGAGGGGDVAGSDLARRADSRGPGRRAHGAARRLPRPAAVRAARAAAAPVQRRANRHGGQGRRFGFSIRQTL